MRLTPCVYFKITTGGYFRGGATTTAQATFYNTTSTYLIARDNSPYSSSVFESSPLRRVLQAGMVGDGFQPGVGGAHFKAVNYRSNNTTADGGIFVWPQVFIVFRCPNVLNLGRLFLQFATKIKPNC